MAYFEELKTWIHAKSLTLLVYNLMRENRDYGFKDQIQRASVSIMNNIAEGSEYKTPQAFIKFLSIAKGSCAEVRSMAYLCKELDYCTEDQFQQLLSECKIISSAINNHIKYLNESLQTSQTLKTP